MSGRPPDELGYPRGSPCATRLSRAGLLGSVLGVSAFCRGGAQVFAASGAYVRARGQRSPTRSAGGVSHFEADLPLIPLPRKSETELDSDNPAQRTPLTSRKGEGLCTHACGCMSQSAARRPNPVPLQKALGADALNPRAVT